MSYYRSICCGILVLVFLVFGELSLNVARDILKGQFWSGDDKTKNVPLKKENGRETEFPFNSKFITESNYRDKNLKIWVSSASHAADHHGKSNQFPNLLCKYLKNEDCYVLNASVPGVLLEGNIEFLKNNAPDWTPDYILLYQAYLDIHHSTRTPSVATDSSRNEKNGIRVVDRVKQSLYVDHIIKKTILRSYSRNYLGSSFLLATPFLSVFPESEKMKFKKRLNDFVLQVRDMGATPVLVTFTSAQGSATEGMAWKYKTWLMRYFEDYSPDMVSSLINEYNGLIREVGLQQAVEVIDLDEQWAIVDRKDGFDDFVHFSQTGHQKVARIISKKLNGIIK